MLDNHGVHHPVYLHPGVLVAHHCLKRPAISELDCDQTVIWRHCHAALVEHPQVRRPQWCGQVQADMPIRCHHFDIRHTEELGLFHQELNDS